LTKSKNRINGCRITLSNREIIDTNIRRIGANLLNFLKLHNTQIKLIKPSIPEETKIVKKLELYPAPECNESLFFT